MGRLRAGKEASGWRVSIIRRVFSRGLRGLVALWGHGLLRGIRGEGKRTF